MFKNTIRKALLKAVKKTGIILQSKSLQLDYSPIAEYGDYATNVAIQTFKKGEKWKSPLDLAEKICQELKKDCNISEILEKLKIAPPGFINFYLSPQKLLTVAKDFTRGKLIRKPEGCFEKKKIMVEFTDPNPFKEFHIGHLYSNIVGESLSRLFESQGAVVKRTNYQGDVGMHVAKSLWGMEQLKSKMPKERGPLSEKAKFMGTAYAFGATKFETDQKIKAEITVLNKKIYARDSSVMELYKRGRKWSLDYFETIYKRLGTKFDYYYFESSAAYIGLNLVKSNISKGIFEKSKGAVVFPGSRYGLHTRVFINSQGLPTYEAKDLGLAPTKYKDFQYDESIIVTGNEVDEYFKVVLRALQKIDPSLAQKTRHISHGMVKVPAGKISSRAGKVLTGEWLLDETRRQILIIFGQNKSILSLTELKAIAEIVALGSVKYALLKSRIGQDIIFDFKKSIAIDGNSGPYLQYTFARCNSVLVKARKLNLSLLNHHDSFKLNTEEMAIVRWIHRFPEVVTDATEQFSPSIVCSFIFELAQKYNTFYNKHQIISKGNDLATVQLRLLVTAAVAQVIKYGLNLLGIETPERM